MSAAQTQAAQAPQGGMQRIPIPLESYQHASLPLSAKKLVNLYAEQQPADARNAVALIAVPGLVVAVTIGSGPIRVINSDLPGVVYVVSGSRFYRMLLQEPPLAPTIDDLGEIGVPALATQDVTVAVGTAAAVVCVPPNAFTCGHGSGDLLNQLGGTFTGAGSVAYLDGYFGFSDPGNSTRWFISGLFDPTNFDALDFAYSDALPNYIRRVIAHRGEFWMMGNAGLEVWYDSGNADFPFRRRPGAVISQGVAMARSIGDGDGSVWWVGPDCIVYRSNGYKAVRVSTHAIERIIEDATRNAFSAYNGYCHTLDGHLVYSVSFDNRTLVYDAATQAWHERSSSVDGTAAWRVQCAASNASYNALGDGQSGKLFFAVLNERNEDGAPVMRQAVLPPLWAATRRGFCSRVEIEMQTLYDSDSLLLEWSDDGGITWGPSRTLQPMTGTTTRKRVYTTRLGSFRQRVFRISSLASFNLFAVDADISAGAS